MLSPSVVLDTNVVISAYLTRAGFERFVLDLALARRLQLFVSSEILEEYAGVLARDKFGFDKNQIAESLVLIRSGAKVVKPTHRVTACQDPFDNKFLECAEAANAMFLVTGNKRHFPSQWRETRVLNARELLAEVIPGLRR